MKENFKSVTGLVLTALLLLSSAAVVAITPNSADAQAGENCKKSSIANISASGEGEGWDANNVVDSDPASSWARGYGEYIQADLGRQSLICSIDISLFTKS